MPARKKLLGDRLADPRNVMLFVLSLFAVIAAVWKLPTVIYGSVLEPNVIKTIECENKPIVRTVDYLIACQQATMTEVQQKAADSLYMINQRWKELRRKDNR